jgi:4-diphosphocytidyl-2-C-methyl-D-erythritol kinase
MYTTRAPAKVNLDLRIVDTRADGYHGLDTVFQSLALADVLTLEPTSGPFTLSCTTPGVPADARNLAWKGAAAVAATVGVSLDGWRLHLEKHVPAEAGLGGGSADAVAAARLVLAALGRPFEASWLADVLAPIGADVAFFVHGGTMRGRGRGDRLERLPDVPTRAVLLVRPDFGVSTRQAYGWFDEQAVEADLGPPDASLGAPNGPDGWAPLWQACRNDLQPPVAARHPVIEDAVTRLRTQGAALALMSGSGSAVFGLFVDDEAARAAACGWPDGWRTWVTHTVDTHTYGALTAVRATAAGRAPLSDPQPVV